MKETTIVLNTIDSKEGEIIERTRTHVIRKDDAGLLRGEFSNPGIEEAAVKLTFTGLNPNVLFQVSYYEHQIQKEMKKANSAGILEFKAIIPAGGKIVLEELPV